MSSDNPITSFPEGYTATPIAGRDSEVGIWTQADSGNMFHWSLRLFIEPHANPLLKRDDDGNVVWDTDALANARWGAVRPIPDSEHPAEGMTVFHSQFNTATGKWEKPFIDDAVGVAFERESENDVGATLDSLCMVDAFDAAFRVFRTIMTSEQRGTTATDMAAMTECTAKVIDRAAPIAIAHAWLMSHGGITMPPQDWVYAESARAFSKAFLAHLGELEQSALGTSRPWQYKRRLIDELRADAKRTGNARFLPRGVTIVETLSSPAVATETTAAAVITKLKAALAPPA